MRDFCKINKDILFGEFINKYSDRSIAILIALMKFKIDKETYIYNKDFLFEFLNVTRTNTAAKSIINESFDLMLSNKVITKCPSPQSLSIIKINENVICNKPWQKVFYEDFETIFATKTKYDKYKILLVYLNIVKWFHGDDGYSFPTNDKLMSECGISSEQSLMNIQKELVNLDLLCMKTYTFNTKDKPTTKNFYAYSGCEHVIDSAIESYTVHLNEENLKIINSEIANKKRSATMKIEHQVRSGNISEEEGDRLKEIARQEINDLHGIINSDDEFTRLIS